jgi:aspartate dehydrogenase
VERRVAIAGLGEIGRTIARGLDAGIPGFTLSAVAVRDPSKSDAFLGALRHRVPCVALGALGQHADIIIECVPAAVFRDVAGPALRAGRQLIVLSAGALLSAPDVVRLAEQFGGRIIVPSGALLGLDAVVAAAQGAIESVTMVSRKPIQGLLGAPFLLERGIAIEGLREPLRVFSGTAREAAVGFPANFNVAAALSLAGVGPDRTRVEIWADPTITRNTHRIEVESDSARFSMTIENIPSGNPKTGRITALSVIALLRKMGSAVTVGT